ncbi:MAG: hypothetical protein ACLFT4_10240, partial [Bacteroidales bacterium]
KISVSSKSADLKKKEHIFNQTKKDVIERFYDYIEEKGYSLGKSSFKKVDKKYKLKENERWADRKKLEIEIIEEPGLCNQYLLRDEINILYFQDLQNALPEWPWPFKQSVNEPMF